MTGGRLSLKPLRGASPPGLGANILTCGEVEDMISVFATVWKVKDSKSADTDNANQLHACDKGTYEMMTK